MRTSRRWSTVALVLGAVLFLVSSLAGFLNANIVNGQRFAAHADQMRQDPVLAQALGDQIAGAVIDADPDLIAVQPALEGAAALTVGSPAFTGVFTKAVASFHSALTEEGSDSAVLTVADLGSSVVSLVGAFSPDLADKIPDNLDVTLAQVGGQGGVAAQIIPWFQAITALALVLPVLAVAFWILGVMLAPDRRIAVMRVGWSLVAVGVALAFFAFVAWVVSRVVPVGELTSALVQAAADEFGNALGLRALVTAVVGGMIVLAASALLPEIHVHERIDAVVRRLARRPQTTGWSIVRGLALIALGAGFVFFPSLALALVAVLVGLVLFLIGLGELDRVAERARESQAAASGSDGWRWAWVFPVLAGVIAIGLVALLLIPAALPQEQSVAAVSADPDACNGHVELCERPLNEVAFPASHNSMSAANEPGWFLAEQPKSLVNSLDDGIRVFLIDTWYGQQTKSGGVVTAPRSLARAQSDFTDGQASELTPAEQRSIERLRKDKVVGPERPYMCHTLCELGATELEAQMVGLRQWMQANPREVVTLFIQDAVTPADTAAVLESAGLAELAYVHEPGASWPTLGEMVTTGRRLLVLMENEGGGQQFPYLHQGFDLVQDTGYTYATVDDFDCALNRGTADSDLLLVNHWLSSFTTLVTSAQKANTLDVLGDRVRTCREERGQIPNFVAVNWYDQGDLLEVVDELNGL
jgi:hypothetical protein